MGKHWCITSNCFSIRVGDTLNQPWKVEDVWCKNRRVQCRFRTRPRIRNHKPGAVRPHLRSPSLTWRHLARKARTSLWKCKRYTISLEQSCSFGSNMLRKRHISKINGRREINKRKKCWCHSPISSIHWLIACRLLNENGKHWITLDGLLQNLKSQVSSNNQIQPKFPPT